MSDPTIDRLLDALPGAVMPDPDVAERIRARVAAELRDQIATDDSAAPDQEVQEVTISVHPTDDFDPPGRRFDKRLIVAAAAAVLVAVIGVVLVTGSDEESVRNVADGGTEQPAMPDPADLPVPATVPPDPTRTFVDGALDVHALPSTNPYRVAVGDDAVWVASLDGTVLELDPATFELRQQFEISESSLVAAGHGSLWVADATTGEVLRYRDGVAIATIETGIRVDDSTFRDGRLGMLEGQRRQFARIGSITTAPGVVWVTDLEGRVLRIDPATNEVVQSIDVALEPHLVRSEGRLVALADQDAEVAAVYDIVTGEEVLRLDGVGAVIGLDLQRGALFVHDGEAATVTRYDVASGEASALVDLGTIPEPIHVPLYPPALRATDAGVLVPNHLSVVVLDPDTLEVVRTLDVNARAGEIAVGPDGTAWLSQFYGRTVTRLRTTTR